LNPPRVPSDSNAIKFGILGAAGIAPPALITPALSHPEVVVYAVAARDMIKAEAFAKKHSIPKVYGGPNGYQGMYVRDCTVNMHEPMPDSLELLNDPDIDVIYNPVRALS